MSKQAFAEHDVQHLQICMPDYKPMDPKDFERFVAFVEASRALDPTAKTKLLFHW